MEFRSSPDIAVTYHTSEESEDQNLIKQNEVETLSTIESIAEESRPHIPEDF